MLLPKIARVAAAESCCLACLVPAISVGGCGMQAISTIDSITNGGGVLDQVSDEGMPANDYCDDVTTWTTSWNTFEEEVLELINQRRAEGADCGAGGVFEPAGPLTMNSTLRCAARNHSWDMAARDYFDHTSPDGAGPGDRLEDAGYSGSAWAENIAWGYSTPEDVVAGWMGSSGHCANLMQGEYTETGVGYYAGNYWTQTFGRP